MNLVYKVQIYEVVRNGITVPRELYVSGEQDDILKKYSTESTYVDGITELPVVDLSLEKLMEDWR